MSGRILKRQKPAKLAKAARKARRVLRRGAVDICLSCPGDGCGGQMLLALPHPHDVGVLIADCTRCGRLWRLDPKASEPGLAAKLAAWIAAATAKLFGKGAP